MTLTLRAIASLHRYLVLQGKVYQDWKPPNFVWDDKLALPKIIDFGMLQAPADPGFSLGWTPGR